MSGSAPNISITISATDLANAKIAALNKTIAGLKAAAAGASKPLNSLGNTSNIARATQSMGAFGDQALGAARAVERLILPMGLLTASASLAGVAALAKNWAETGNTIKNTAYPLSMAGEKFNLIQIAANMAGGSVEGATTSMQGFSQALSDANFSRNGPLAGMLTQARIGFTGVGDKARTAEEALGDYARRVWELRGDPGAVAKLVSDLHGTADFIPFLFRMGESMEMARKTHGNMTQSMIEKADLLRKSWLNLSWTLTGVTNRIVEAWSPLVTRWLNDAAKWIQANEELAGSIATGMLAAVTLFVGSSAVARMLKILGVVVEAGALLRAMGLLTLAGDTPTNSGRVSAEQEAENRRKAIAGGAVPLGSLWDWITSNHHQGDPNWAGQGGPLERSIRRGLGMPPPGGAASPTPPGPRADATGAPPEAFIMHHTGGRGTVAGVQETLRRRGLGVEYIMDREGNITVAGGRGSKHIMPGWGEGAGLNNANTVGMEVIANDDSDITAAQVAAAKKFIAENYPNIRVLGHGQVNPGHKQATEGATISNAIQNDRMMDRLNALRPATPWHPRGWDRDAIAPEEPRRMLNEDEIEGPPRGTTGTFGPASSIPPAPLPLQGSVKVDLHMHGAPVGTVARMTTTGIANATPPRIETNMPFAA